MNHGFIDYIIKLNKGSEIVKNKEYSYMITASMCGLQSGNSTFERIKDTSSLIIAIFWFVIFTFKYSMAYITYGKDIPKCEDCKRNRDCKYEVDGI